jgi:hypothetical protein
MKLVKQSEQEPKQNEEMEERDLDIYEYDYNKRLWF